MCNCKKKNTSYKKKCSGSFTISKLPAMKTLKTNQHSSIWNHIMVQVLCLLLVVLNLNFFAQPLSNNVLANSSSKTSNFAMFRLQMKGLPNFQDECVVYYQNGATDGFDSSYDAYKIFGPNPAPHISIEYNSTLMAVNGIDPVVTTFTTNIKATTNAAANFTISASDVQGLPSGTCVFLTDLFTNAKVNLLLTPYAFLLSDTTASSRFVLTITYNTLPLVSSLTSPDCENPSVGKFKVSPSSFAPWNYLWKDSSDNVIKTMLNVSNPDSLGNVSPGAYKVQVVSASDACKRNEVNFNINPVILPTVAFASHDSLTLSSGAVFSPTNTSINCVSYFWDFGDGTGNSNSFEPTYYFSNSGTYHVKVIGTSSAGCKDSMAKTITVADIETIVSESVKQSCQLINLGYNHYLLKLPNEYSNGIKVAVTDLNGKQQPVNAEINTADSGVLLNLNDLSGGLYVFSVYNQTETFFVTKLIVK